MQYMALRSYVDPITRKQLLKGQVVSYVIRLSDYPAVPEDFFQIVMTTPLDLTPLCERLTYGFDTTDNAKYTF